MVYVEDVGTILDVPIDLVWDYMASKEHGQAHQAGLRNMTVQELTPTTSRFEAERNPHGTWERFAGITTDLAPVGILNEETESSTAGTKMAFLYSPRGTKTQVDVFADACSTTVPESQAVREVLDIAEGAYDEDFGPLREFAKGKTSRPGASVRLADVGGRYAVPVDTVWEYLLDESAHDRAHVGTRNERYEALPGGSFVFAFERDWNGTWTPETMRVTPLRPVAMGAEWLAGPLAGSKTITVYRPRSGDTQVDVHGEFVSSTLGRAELERLVPRIWAQEFEEDTAALRDRART